MLSLHPDDILSPICSSCICGMSILSFALSDRPQLAHFAKALFVYLPAIHHNIRVKQRITMDRTDHRSLGSMAQSKQLYKTTIRRHRYAPSVSSLEFLRLADSSACCTLSARLSYDMPVFPGLEMPPLSAILVQSLLLARTRAISSLHRRR